MNLLRFQYRHIPKATVGLLLTLMLASVPTPRLNAQQPGTEIVFSARLQVSDELWPVLFQSLRADLAVRGDKSPNGIVPDQNPTLIRRRDFVPGTAFDSILQVELRGRCDLVARAYPAFPDRPPGWIPIVSGRQIQPFISIDCTHLAESLARTALDLNKEERRHVMAQAIANVLIHELIHIATQRPAHETQGVMKASISVKTLIAEPPTNVCRLEPIGGDAVIPSHVGDDRGWSFLPRRGRHRLPLLRCPTGS
jgi:hypothetical protein